ncbi:GntR family transcriptional regulator [Methylobacterium brachiatum]|jgi:GntR family histidine utilization transcriptional repressor|uniref:GntR family transcriptional regulator n=1 Tax=Methylobacterium brachiatum TaxID=269660 RepID=UPI002446ADE3|nr:GntR family transcriptional regulator [Methylobacterium brachiatum]MDH2312382.1 GntR family transcriptional regulator [Methylobacterium brachiatum]
MTRSNGSSYRVIRDEIARRIGEQIWKPGSLIPGEEALRIEFGAARATVNRALQELARAGLIERKRKVGTRVVLRPMREARFVIPIVSQEIEAQGHTYTYRLLARRERMAEKEDALLLDVEPGTVILHLKCLHLADGRPYQFEDRLINPAAAPQVLDEPFEVIGPNEWLVTSAPFTRGEFSFLADRPSAEEADILGIAPHAPVFVGERRTWLLARPITFVRMVHPQTHRLRSAL